MTFVTSMKWVIWIDRNDWPQFIVHRTCRSWNKNGSLHVENKFDGSTSIRCSDTDALVIVSWILNHVKCSLKISVAVGVGINAWHCMNISEFYDQFGKNLCMYLHGFHAFTGYN